jgi:hypothetical protein
MDRIPRATVYAGLGLLSIVGFIGCTTPSVTVNLPAYVRFHVQMGLIVDADHVQVLVQKADGTCGTTNALRSRLIDVLERPNDPTNRTTWNQLFSCSAEWVLPQPAAERTREYQVSGPNNGTLSGHIIATDASQNSSNTVVRSVEMDVTFPQGSLGTPVHTGVAQANLQDNNTLLSTARGNDGYFSFTPTVLDLSATPRQGMGEFQFLAANPTDPTDQRLLIVLEGSFAIEPNSFLVDAGGETGYGVRNIF